MNYPSNITITAVYSDYTTKTFTVSNIMDEDYRKGDRIPVRFIIPKGVHELDKNYLQHYCKHAK